MNYIPSFFVYKGYMGIFKTDLLIYGASYTLLVFIGLRSIHKADGVSEIDLVFQDANNILRVPLVGLLQIQLGILLPLLAIIVMCWGEYLTLF